MPDFDESNLYKLAEEDPNYNLDRELRLLRERYGYCELSTENEKLFWFMHDVVVLGYDIASQLHGDLEIPSSELFSVQIRMRGLARYFNELKYGRR